jgi:hypothetical protein
LAFSACEPAQRCKHDQTACNCDAGIEQLIRPNGNARKPRPDPEQAWVQRRVYAEIPILERRVAERKAGHQTPALGEIQRRVLEIVDVRVAERRRDPEASDCDPREGEREHGKQDAIAPRGSRSHHSRRFTAM